LVGLSERRQAVHAPSPGHWIKASAFERRRILLGLLAAGLLLVGALGVAAGGLRADHPPPPRGAGVVYTLKETQASVETVRFRALDPATLADRADLDRAFARETSWAFATDWAVSADGSTYLGLKYGWDDTAEIASNRPAETTIVIRDVPTGKERSRFHVDGQQWLGRLSDDGSRLLLVHRSDVAPAQWSAYATATGRLLATWSGEELDVGLPVALDDRRAFFLTATNGPNPLPSAQVVAYDLQSGAEIGRQRLDAVVAGTWQTARLAGGIPVRERRAPGLALSPDGHQLAVVDADGTRLTLLDADRVRVERSISLARSLSWLDWVPLFPQRAYAKEGEEAGAFAEAVFSRDGALLYVTSRSVTVDDHSGATARGSGLAVVDLERGNVRAEALASAPVLAVVPSVDGNDLYAITENQPGHTSYLLLRLDARSLTEKARQDVTTPQTWIMQTPEESRAGSPRR